MKMILIVIPTLDPERGLDVGQRAQASAACDTRLEVIHDETGVGFTRTVNRGLRMRRPGEDVCILNDDITAFTYGWLRILHGELYTDDGRGIVGPSGKSASSPKSGRLGGNGTQVVGMLPFWCVLIKSALLDQIPLMDERFIHYSADTMYCYQARDLGYQNVWVKSVYLWHQHEGSGFRREWRRKDTETFKRLNAARKGK